MKGKAETDYRTHTLILNSNAEDSAFLRDLSGRFSSVDTAPGLEEAIRKLSRTDYDAVVVDASLAEYSRLRGLFRKKTGLIITGFSDTQLRRIAREWPVEHHVDVAVIAEIRQNSDDFSVILNKAVTRARLIAELSDLRADRERSRIDMGEAFHQIGQIKKVVESSVVREIEKRLNVESRLRWFRREKQRVESILKKIYLSNDITSLLEIFSDIRDLVEAEGISFYLLDKHELQGHLLKPLVWGGTIPSLEEIARLVVELEAEDIAALVVLEGQEINIREPEKDARLTDRYQRLRVPLNNLLCIPIRHDKEVIGALEVYNKNGGHAADMSFSASDQRILRQMCEHISIAINKLNLIQYDALTGLLRPDPFFKKIFQKMSEKQKRRTEEAGYALVMGDVDWFKHYNDRNGHEAGNRLLRELSLTLRSSIREKDLLCRYGGEEFLFFLQGIENQEQALMFTDRIRRNVEDQPFENQEFQPRGNLTMSFGVTCFDRTNFPNPEEMTPADLKRWIIEANLAMAEAKGKNMLSDPSSEDAALAPDKNRTSIFQPGLMRENVENRAADTATALPSEEEKRRYPRYMTSLSMIYKIDNGHRVTKTLNLSLGGAKISTDHILSDGHTLELTVILGKSAFRCKGEIVYSVKSGEGFSACYSGLKFWDLSLNDRGLLEKYISSLSVKKPRLF